MRYFIVCIHILAACCLLTTGCSIANVNADSFASGNYMEKTFLLEQPAKLSIISFSSNIELYTWKHDKIKVEMEKKALDPGDPDCVRKLKNIKINIQKDDLHKIVFEAAYKGFPINSDRHSVDIKLHIPSEVQLICLELDKGSIKIHDDLTGQLKAKLGRVDFDINNIRGTINIKGKKSNIRIFNGKIDSGSTIEQDVGNIKVRTDLDKNGSYLFKTGMGNISLLFPYDAKLETRCIGNTKINEFENRLNFATVVIRCSMGDIYLKKYFCM